ncbi:hypothetical protein GA0115251_131111 [Streptomyces sp. TverLS-915]|nr:hypothetical protein GA0115251_131111 [Streptomyces sp. TverLS-915]
MALGQAARRNAAETPEADTLVDLVRLADVEPGLRRAWLQANNEAEAALTQAIARRYGGDPASPQVRLQAAMAAAAIRVVAEDFAHEASPPRPAPKPSSTTSCSLRGGGWRGADPTPPGPRPPLPRVFGERDPGRAPNHPGRSGQFACVAGKPPTN